MRFKTKTAGVGSDPVEVFEGVLGRHENCFLLESLGEGASFASNQSYIGVQPDRLIEDYDELKSFKPQQSLPGHYIGGLVGYMSHEALQHIEPTLGFGYERYFPDLQFGEYKDGLIFYEGKPTEYFYYDKDRLDLYKTGDITYKPLSIEYKYTAKDERQYKEMVEKARQDIINGRVFQAVLANKHEYRFQGELFQLYKELRRINPSPYMFFIKFGDRITMGASPELLSYTNPVGRTCIEGLAGTIKRGVTTEEDKRLANQLLSDEKEIAEHSMLLDLLRNDIGRVSRIGSVKIDKQMYIKKFSHVQHICSLVSGQLEANKTAFDALTSVFPNGTLVGAPKIEAAKMINELEGYERGPFGGSVGYFSYNGDSMHAVNIRSIHATGEKLFLHNGSGIVYDSQPEREFQEVAAKKAAMDRAMERFLK